MKLNESRIGPKSAVANVIFKQACAFHKIDSSYFLFLAVENVSNSLAAGKPTCFDTLNLTVLF